MRCRGQPALALAQPLVRVPSGLGRLLGAPHPAQRVGQLLAELGDEQPRWRRSLADDGIAEHVSLVVRSHRADASIEHGNFSCRIFSVTVEFLPMTQIPAIETEGLTKRFGEFTAVADLDLRVETGTVVSLLGPNGAGKTTTVRMLATLSAPGRRVCPCRRLRRRPRRRARCRALIALTGQFAALDKNLTARENLVLMARLRGRGRREAAAVAES